ncbi:Protein kinase domain-containing protein [Cinnamomum micranthum f. kanehirae]|uniref:Protein kinase domain-containing protein n=1 Tax=Cinnamomum micranthum f. kanehirae TaxID=337451 RepID=A0A3S3NNM4_9MAGN|nr:Protein kinase domain-containing protein [Cinnamomum micranthum f. kanehirae]
MGFQSLILVFTLSLLSFSPLLLAQQPYARRETIKCASRDNSTSVDGYSCNGQNQSCQSYLIFRSRPPYDSVANISQLFTSDPYQLSQINSVSRNATFQSNKEVIVPVNCSCSGPYYQANTSYVVKHGDTRYGIATDIYQGLVSCRDVRKQTCCSLYIYTGMNVTIPLRCACPTTNQTSKGVKYLLTYLVTSDDSVSSVSRRFGSDVFSTLDANELSEEVSEIFQSSTLLIPLRKKPSSDQTIITPTPSSPPTPRPSPLPSDKSSMKVGIQMIIGVAVGGGAVMIVSIGLFCVLAKRKKRVNPIVIRKKQDESNESALPKELLAGISDPEHMLKIYEFEELQLATKKFGSKCRIEGSVYRGVINGDAVAIKNTDGDALKEINLHRRINHNNIIRLLGVCFSRGHWYLVYEYARNGSLSSWIFHRNDTKTLSWMQRVQISLDVAYGLDYLHNYTIPSHVHNNLKSSNILLDSNFRGKVANFSLARSFEGLGDGCLLTKHITGTQGYMAPEYLENGLISPKLDVYALGVVMVEIITGKEAVVAGEGGAMQSSEAFIAFLDEENDCGKLSEFMDPSLQGNHPLNLFMTMAELIQCCLRKDAASRPSMTEITQCLLRIFSQFLIFLCFASLISHTPLLLLAQQPYAVEATIKCDNNTDDTAVVGYICNGQNVSCQAYLIFRSKPPYDSVASISKLFTSDPYQLSKINSVSEVYTFQTNKEVIVPVNCSCFGHYYQANTSYAVKHGDTRYIIATNIYEGLVWLSYYYSKQSWCEVSTDLFGGIRRFYFKCKSEIWCRYREHSKANELYANNSIYPSSTLLIPLQNQPSSSQTTILQPPPSLPTDESSKKAWIKIVTGVAVGGSVLIVFIGSFCLFSRKKKKGSLTLMREKCVESRKRSALPEELLADKSNLEHRLRVYNIKELQLATKKFSSKCRIDGSLYRGVSGGDVVAIKNMKGDVSKEFNLLKKINHFNIIRLLGVCFNKGHWYFVYFVYE